VPTCFIIMPITVRKDLVSEYHGGEAHFGHVLRHLFTPAVEGAGYKPISPKAKGSEMIHGEIITNLQTADLVLCDMSTLNANVFMELGIRTSLNQPVCLVKDDKTAFVPFDTTVLNHHTYNCLLDPWVIEKEVPTLADHIAASAKTCAGSNPLWKYFGLTASARAPEAGTVDDKMALLTAQIERLTRTMERWPMSDQTKYKVRYDKAIESIIHAAQKSGLSPVRIAPNFEQNLLEVNLSKQPPSGSVSDFAQTVNDLEIGPFRVRAYWDDEQGVRNEEQSRGN
jgi:hypothetical protein